MPKSTSYHEALIEDIKEPLEAASYIEAVLEDGDPKMLSKALKNILEAQGGIENFSSQIQDCYQKLNQMLLEKGEINFFYLNTLLNALGLQFTVQVKSA